MIVSCSFRVDPHDIQEGERRPVTQCQAVSGLLGLMAAASNVVTFALLYMRPLQWWLKTKGFSLRGNPQCKLRDRHVLVRTGNTAVVSYINHQGGLRSHPLYRLAHQILGWSQGKLFSLRTVHIPGHLNMGADILSRQGPRPGEWRLHPEVVKQTWRVWPGSGGSVCDSRDMALSPLVLSDRFSVRLCFIDLCQRLDSCV